MAQVPSHAGVRPIAPQAAAPPVAPPRPTVVTRPSRPQSGEDGRGGESQGRGWEQAAAKRPLTFQDALLSSTTLSGLREALGRLGGNRVSGSNSRAAGRKDAKDQDQAATAAVIAAGGGGQSGDDKRTAIQAHRGAKQEEILDNGGDGYYGPDWEANSQLLEASRLAVANYRQGLAAQGDFPYAVKAEVMDLVA